MDGAMLIIIITIIKTLKFSINVVFVSEQCSEREGERAIEEAGRKSC
jgi:hypothetical protein